MDVVITNEVVGTANIRLIGHENFDNNDSPSTLKVNLYKMNVTDKASNKVSTYHVTRDSYVATGQDDDTWTDKETFVRNYAFEPDKETGEYKGVAMSPYPSGTDFGAVALKNKDGSDGLSVDSNRGTGKATDITIHVGGEYTRLDGSESITGSLGCFTLSGKDGGNSGIKAFYKDISNRNANNNYKGINISVQKRNNVDWNFEVDSDGDKVNWNW